MLAIIYRQHKTNDYVRKQTDILVGYQEFFLSIVKRRKLLWLGHVCRHDAMPEIILKGSVGGSRRI